MGEAAEEALEWEMRRHGIGDRPVREGRYPARPRPKNYLHQDTEWLTKEGQLLKLTEMTSSHRQNLIRYLERRAPELHDIEYRTLLTGLLSVRGELATDALEQAGDEHIATAPIDWIRNTKVMRKLRELEGFD